MRTFTYLCNCYIYVKFTHLCNSEHVNANTYPSIFIYVQIYSWVWPSVKVYLLLHTYVSEFLVMWMQSKFAYVYFCSLGCCDWCWLQHLLFIVLQLHTCTWIRTRICDEVSTPKISTVANVYSQHVYLAKMSTVPTCPSPKCLVSWLNPEGPFRKEISLIHKEFSRLFGILLKTLQPVLTVCIMSLFSGKCLLSYCTNYMREGMYSL